MTDHPPPRPARRPVTTVRFGEEFVDPYTWLRDRDDPAVIAHLEAENAHTDAVLGPLDGLRASLFDELRSRVQEDDASAPVVVDDWCYYQREVAGKQYPIHCRRPFDGDPARRLPVDPRQPPADEQVLLDENVLAEGRAYLAVGGLAVSPDHRWLAHLVDTSGAERHTLRIRDLATGEDVELVTEQATYGLVWHTDSSALLYLVPDEAWRPHQVWRHRLATPPEEDELVFQEDDERFWMGIGRTRSRDHLVISIGSKSTSEVWLLDAHDATATPWVVARRVEGVEYSVDHAGGDELVVLSNRDGAVDFAVSVAPVAAPADWRPLVAHRPGVRVEDVDAFVGHLVLSERTEARTQLRVVGRDGADRGVLAMPEEVYTTAVGANPVADTDVLRIAYTSLTTPLTVLDVDLATGARTTIKQDEVPGGYAPDEYTTVRAWATSHDGTRVPLSIVHRRDVDPAGAPCLLYGYGAYEVSTDPTFRSWRLSWLDRGGVFAIGHVRGGGELGRAWYEQGRFGHKPNSFHDFVACADHLVAEGWTTRERLAIEGGSAGGLLVAATLNLRPDLCRAAAAVVPFVDVLNTMSDPTLPLTVPEYEEWGDPGEEDAFRAIRSYSPYDNVQAADYPALLVTAGLNDPRVGYWEPAKWVARLRDLSTGDHPILLRTELGAGHAGPSGRYEALRERALLLAFTIWQLGMPRTPVSG